MNYVEVELSHLSALMKDDAVSQEAECKATLSKFTKVQNFLFSITDAQSKAVACPRVRRQTPSPMHEAVTFTSSRVFASGKQQNVECTHIAFES